MTTPRLSVAGSIEVDAPASVVFDLLADPARHVALDGAGPDAGVGQVRGLLRGPDRLSLGARFATSMRLGVPYAIVNRVVEFDEGRRIAWTHVSQAVWRYELEPLGTSSVRVTETFDLGHSWLAPIYQRLDVLRRNESGIRRSLAALKGIAEHEALLRARKDQPGR